jgi:propanediol dehydratase small subunit
MIKYPLSQNMPPESIKSKTGKSIKDITIENILSGNIKAEDIKISKETLLLQGEISEKEGRPQLKENFQRASEIIEVPDNILLGIYDKLRPNRSTKDELIQIAEELIKSYGAHNCAKLIMEAVQVYEKRGLFKK